MMSDSSVKVRLSKEQDRVLYQLSFGAAAPRDLIAIYPTFCALERLGLIRVETTFESVAFPNKALGHITDSGRALLQSKGGK